MPGLVLESQNHRERRSDQTPACHVGVRRGVGSINDIRIGPLGSDSGLKAQCGVKLKVPGLTNAKNLQIPTSQDFFLLRGLRLTSSVCACRELHSGPWLIRDVSRRGLGMPVQGLEGTRVLCGLRLGALPMS